MATLGDPYDRSPSCKGTGRGVDMGFAFGKFTAVSPLPLLPVPVSPGILCLWGQSGVRLSIFTLAG